MMEMQNSRAVPNWEKLIGPIGLRPAMSGYKNKETKYILNI